MIYITVSTGVGGGIIIDGELYHGFSDIAGEVGHITIDIDGPFCSCGNAGCLEELASGRAVTRAARETLAKGGPSLMRELCGGDIQLVTPELVGEAAAQSDPMALAVVEQIGTYLGIGVASLVNILNPQRVVIGGGVSKIGTPLFQVVRRTVRERAVSSCADVVEIVPAELGDDVGIIGAALLVRGSLET
jgi:glucokinase